MPPTKSEIEALNKRVVLEFFEKVLIPMDFTLAPQFFGAYYKQHSPLATDGPEGLHAFLDRVRVESPNAKTYIKRVFADGDHVIVHSHVIIYPGTPGIAVVDIIRLENGKLVEHWEVTQPVPTEMLHSNTMF
ncbi:MAG TPA: nuclear transport factor 2 family protein [Candidatus Baltobacteraceae bacterium]|nr:nuclear transport factor 2 family protein [Candidatus Baltobacteraceae bacterium]